MNALELADELDHASDLGEFKHYEAAAMLRRQHKAIVKLREALTNIEHRSSLDSYTNVLAKQALKDTEGLV